MQWWCAANGAVWSWEWRAYPGIWCFVALLAALGYWRLRRSAHVEPLRSTAWGAGVLLAWLALDWPLGALGSGYLLTAHTVQYLLLTFGVAPLLLWGGSGGVRDGARVPHARPLACLLAYNGILAVTHVPAVVDGLMTRQLGAATIDLGWLVGGIVLWWPLLHPDPRQRLSPPVQIGYLFGSTILPTMPAAFLTFATYPLYRIYEMAPRVTGLSAQRISSLQDSVMKLGADPFVWVTMAVIFFRWQRVAETEGNSLKRPRALA